MASSASAWCAGMPPSPRAAEVADAAVELLRDDTLARRVVVVRGGEPRRLLPIVDWRAV